jgi:peptidoglycan/xylan/chitin deacetylase (PgdA/CDA1 family)
MSLTLRSFATTSALFASALLVLTGAGCSQKNSSSPVAANDTVQEDLFQQKSIQTFGLRGTKKVAITVDDGPSANTMEMLKVFRDEDVKAAFFMQGSHVTGHETALTQMKADRHIVANHTFSHVNLREMKYLTDTSALVSQIAKTHKLLEPYLSSTQRFYFRAPYGNWRAEHAGVLNENAIMAKYIGPIFWTIGGEVRYDSAGKLYSAADWDCWGKKISVEACAAAYVRETESQQGGVLLMHDVDNRSVKMIKLVIRELKARGYTFITLDDVRSLDQYE